MSGSSSSNVQNSPLNVDPTQLASFVSSGQGAQYANQFDPTNQYFQFGNSVRAGKANSGQSQDATSFMNAFQTWQQGNTNSQNAWQNYATLVQQQGGGQGQQTILGSPTQPTSALGTAASKLVGKP